MKYKNILHALVETGMSKKDLATKLGWSYSRLLDKLNGRVKLTYDEAIEIKSVLNAVEPIEYLFAKTA